MEKLAGTALIVLIGFIPLSCSTPDVPNRRGVYLLLDTSGTYTDISGGFPQADEYLKEQSVGREAILIFPDMQEALPKGYNRDIALSFDNVEVVAVNVTKLRTDNIDSREYLDRLAAWRGKVEGGGGQWRVVNDLDRLGKLLDAAGQVRPARCDRPGATGQV